MKNLAEKGGFIWVALAVIPIAAFTSMIGKATHIDSSIIIGIQLPFLAVQLFSIFMIIRYWRQIF